jgi:hypothetical protein
MSSFTAHMPGFIYDRHGGRPMYSKEEFVMLELMCREVAELAKREMEYSLSEYWLAEAEEWKRLAGSATSSTCRIK